MTPRRPGCRILAALVCATAIAVGALPAHAFFSVEERGSTITVNQNDTATLIMSRNPGGELVIGDGVTIVAYPAAKNLVVRGSSALTTTSASIVLNEPLPGSLTLDLPGASDVTIAGPAAVIRGSLTVKGSDAAKQTVRFGDSGQPVTIDGNVKLDLRDVADWVEFRAPAKILGSLQAKGVNRIRAGVLEVGGSFSIDVSREGTGVDLYAEQILVGKSLKVSSGSGHDSFGLDSLGAVGGSATFTMGDGGCQINARFRTGGKLTARLGRGGINEFYPAMVKGAVDVASFADSNYLELRGPIEGRSIKYTGGAGRDDLLLQSAAPRATATISLGGGNDRVALYGQDLQLALLRLDMGEGTDELSLVGGYVPPPGSTITGLP